MNKPKNKKFDSIFTVMKERFPAYKVADLACMTAYLDVPSEDIEYIMAGGEEIQMKPAEKLQKWLAGAMDRMEEKVPAGLAKQIRRECACCLGGVRDKLAREIFKSSSDIDERFEEFSKERRIVGGKAWKGEDGYYVTYWYDKPKDGYTCGCLGCVPTEPMNKLWCECCAGHIQHHFETALGVKSECECITSVLSSCGNDACLFRLNIIEKR